MIPQVNSRPRPSPFRSTIQQAIAIGAILLVAGLGLRWRERPALRPVPSDTGSPHGLFGPIEAPVLKADQTSSLYQPLPEAGSKPEESASVSSSVRSGGPAASSGKPVIAVTRPSLPARLAGTIRAALNGLFKGTGSSSGASWSGSAATSGDVKAASTGSRIIDARTAWNEAYRNAKSPMVASTFAANAGPSRHAGQPAALGPGVSSSGNPVAEGGSKGSPAAVAEILPVASASGYLGPQSAAPETATNTEPQSTGKASSPKGPGPTMFASPVYRSVYSNLSKADMDLLGDACEKAGLCDDFWGACEFAEILADCEAACRKATKCSIPPPTKLEIRINSEVLSLSQPFFRATVKGGSKNLMACMDREGASGCTDDKFVYLRTQPDKTFWAGVWTSNSDMSAFPAGRYVFYLRDGVHGSLRATIEMKK